jgi:hypothetical protein
MFRKLNIISIALISVLLSTPSSAIETLVDFGSVISESGKSTLGDARFKIIPNMWTLKATKESIYKTDINWKEGVRWTTLLDVIGQKEGISFVVDGASKNVYATKSIGMLSPGVLLVNSRVKAQRELYKIDLLNDLANKEDIRIVESKKVADMLELAKTKTSKKTPVTIAEDANEKVNVPSSLKKKDGLRIRKSNDIATNKLADAFVKETANSLYIHSEWITENWYDHLQFKSLGKLSDRLWYDSTKSTFVFQLKAGTLKSNLKALLLNTKKTEALDPSGILSRHHVYNDMVVSGESVLHLVDKIISPYNEPSQIRGEAYPNHVISFDYETTVGVR